MEQRNITMRCDCGAEAVVFTRYDYNLSGTSYGLSFEDSYLGGSYTGFLGRIKRAWKAFISKPVVHADVFTDDEEKMKTFLKDCLSLMLCESNASPK
jgi:hypothetical protein